MRVISLLLILSLSTVAGGATVAVTNVAGRVLAGELVSVTESAVRLRLAGGAVCDIPLRVLKRGEAERLRSCAGMSAASSPAVIRLERDRDRELARIDARLAAGTLSSDAAARKRAEIKAWTNQRIAKIHTEETR